MATRVARTLQAGNGFGLANRIVRVVEVGTFTGQVTYRDPNGDELTERTMDIDALRFQAERGVAGLVSVDAVFPGGQVATRRMLARAGEVINEQFDLPQTFSRDPSRGRVIGYRLAWMTPQKTIATLIEMDDPPITPREAIRRMVPNVAYYDKLIAQYTGVSQVSDRRRYRRHRRRVLQELRDGGV